MSKKMRTSSGHVKAKARKQYGMKSKTAKKGSFPIFDKKSADSALRLRGHAHTKKDRKNIINRARKYDAKKASEAYKKDKEEGKV